MPQFHFHFREGDVVLKDDSGVAYESVEEAYLGAFEAATDVWRELLRERRDPLRCAFEVTDAGGEALFDLPFTEVLDTCRTGRWHKRRSASAAFVEIIQAFDQTRKTCRDLKQELKVVRATLEETRRLMAQADRLTKPVQPGRKEVESV